MKKINTAEKFYKTALITFLVIEAAAFILFAGVSVLLLSAGENGWPLLCAAICWVVIWSFFVIYYAVQYRHYKTVVLTDVQTVKLERINTSFVRRAGFVVTVFKNGTPTAVTTKCVFGVGLVGPNLLDDYAGRTVEIGYHAARNEWIVITPTPPSP